MLLVVSAHTNETGMEEAIGPGFCGTSENYFNANFHEKAHFVKADLAAHFGIERNGCVSFAMLPSAVNTL